MNLFSSSNTIGNNESRLHYSLIVILIIVSARASAIANSDLFLVIFTFFSGFIFYIKKLKFDKSFLLLSYIYICITIIYLIKFGYVNFSASLRFYIKIIYAYFTIKVTKNSFFEFYEDIIFKLALISLPLFALQVLFPDFMVVANKSIQRLIPSLEYAGESSNSFIFTINANGINRNSGFAWEPGGFSAFLALAMMLNLAFNQFKPNFRLVIFVIAMITTFSTTGYLMLGIIAFYAIQNINGKYLIILTPFLILGIIYISSLDFVSNKIMDEYSSRDQIIENLEDYSENEFTSLGRFGSLVVDFEDFKGEPLFGVGLQEDERTQSMYTRLQHTNGLSFYLVMFGAVGMIFLIYGLNYSFRYISEKYNTKGNFLFVLIVLTLSFSNPVLATPIFIGLQIFFMCKS